MLGITEAKDGSNVSVGYSYSELPVNSIAVSYDSKGGFKWAKSDGKLILSRETTDVVVPGESLDVE